MRGVPLPVGALVPPIQGLIAAILGLGILLIPARPRSAVIEGILWVVLVGTLRDQILIIDLLKPQPVSAVLKSVVFARSGLTLIGALLVFAITAGLAYYRSGRKKSVTVAEPTKIQQRNRLILIAVLAAILLVLPYATGVFFTEILDTTGLFIMMGLGLNIVVGFAGLLDLGYVAFYAIGAYSMGVLTSSGLGHFQLTFWQALPIALFWLRSYERQGVNMDEYPNVRRWFDKINARPAVQRGLQVLAERRRTTPLTPEQREVMFGSVQFQKR